MEKSIKGSLTEKNLLKSFAGESQAKNRYTYFSKQAKKEGYEQIREFCTKNYGVTFPMMSKISVKGKDIDPLYHWLTSKEENGVMDAPVKWNFQKFMIDENGKLVGMVPPGDLPTCDKIVNWIENKK